MTSRGVGELGDDQEEEVGLVQAGDVDVERELLDHLPSGRRELGDVLPELVGNVAGVVEEDVEVERRGVVEPLPGDLLQARLDILDLSRELPCPLPDRRLGSLQDAVQASEDDHGQDHPPVLRPFVVAAEKVGDLPDEACVAPNGLRVHLAGSVQRCHPSRKYQSGPGPGPRLRPSIRSDEGRSEFADEVRTD